MIYFRILAVFIALLGLSGQCYAYSGPPSFSVSSGKIMILPPTDDQREEQWRGAYGKSFKSGKWLALVCNADKCRLAPVMLKVINYRRPKGEIPENFISHAMRWDLSAIHKDENIVMFVLPQSGLLPGTIQTWYVLQNGGTALSLFGTAKTGEKTVIVTKLTDKPERQSVLVPKEVTNRSCSEAQAAKDECERKTFRVHLQEGKIFQWLGAPLTSRCYPLDGNHGIPTSYLRWVGDLDQDLKPDYFIYLSAYDGYILMLSSLAKPGQLVGEAGRYKPWFSCD